jgi:adenylate cyclase
MNTERAKRKLSAILSADVKGYSRLMGKDEVATVRTLKEYREAMSKLIKEFRGRVVDSPGDNVLAEFASVVDALECSIEIQKNLKTKNDALPDSRKMEFRIGVNLGDVIEDEERVYGDGVNIAARIEGLAEPGGICISGSAFEQVRNKVLLGYESLGEHAVKNIVQPIKVYRVLMESEAAGKVIGEKESRETRWGWKAVAALAVLILVTGGLVWHFYGRAPKIEPASKEKMAFPLPDKPSIAVLPFVNMTGDAKQEYMADGITENIITALSKVPEVFVIARNTAFTYKGKPVKINKVSEELGVQYVLEGSIQQSENRLRITAQLINATGGHHLWAERFDRDLSDIFVLQDKVTLDILSALRVEFTHGEQARVQETTKSLEAWSCLVKGLSHFESFTKDDNARAQELFKRAVQVDPEYSYALAMLGWTHWIDAAFGYSESDSESFKKAVEIARKALQMDDRLPDVHALWGGIYLFQGQYDKAIAEGQRAVALAPNVACNKALLARTMLLAGKFEEALNLVKSAMRHNPHYPSWYLESLAMTYGVTGEHEKAIASFKELLNLRRNARGNTIMPLLGLAANSAILGRENEAKAYAKEILGVNPDFSLEQFRKINPFKNPSHLKPFLEALRKVGIPDKPPLPLPDKPSIAVLPFVNMSEDKSQEFFSDGLTEEIITALSKTPKLFVIARNSTFVYKGKPVNVQQVSRELGVKYVLEGSVRRSGDQLRITAQLIDATTSNHLWAERYERAMGEIFAVQDEITLAIVHALRITLTSGEQARLVGKGTKNLEAYLKAIEANEQFFLMNRQGSLKAKEFAREAISTDPYYAFPYAILANAHMLDAWFLFAESYEGSMKLADDAARKALSLDENDPYIQSSLTNLYVMQREHEKAIASAERALATGPSASRSQSSMGVALYFSCRFSEAIPFFEEAIRMDPYPPGPFFRLLGGAYSGAGLHEEALKAYEKALKLNPNDIFTHLTLAAQYAELGRDEQARAEVREVLRLHPKFSLESFAKTLTFKDQSFVSRRLELMRKAGLK